MKDDQGNASTIGCLGRMYRDGMWPCVNASVLPMLSPVCACSLGYRHAALLSGLLRAVEWKRRKFRGQALSNVAWALSAFRCVCWSASVRISNPVVGAAGNESQLIHRLVGAEVLGEKQFRAEPLQVATSGSGRCKAVRSLAHAAAPAAEQRQQGDDLC